MEEKRIYSFNLSTYVIYRTNLTPEIKRDQEGLYYCVFPECMEIGQAIKEYKDYKKPVQVDLHEFLNVYKQLRDDIKEQRILNDEI